MLFALVIIIALGITAPLRADPSTSEELAVTAADTLVDQKTPGGYNLWIRAKPGIASVLITETTADPARRAASYALRDPKKNPVNGDERRLLNGKPIDPSRGLYSLIDSTPEMHPDLGRAFHIFIPYIVVYGYPWSRQGEIQVLDGTFLNIRAFALPYGDYTGAYRDNPFVMRMTQKVHETPAGTFNPDTVETFTSIAREGGGEAVQSSPEELPQKIAAALDSAAGPELDLVLALDTTESMTDDLPILKKSLVPMIRKHTNRFKSFRVGLLMYRDYFEDYLTRPLPMTDSLEKLQAQIDAARAEGGRDLPEAVYEALYASIHSYEWAAPSRRIILVGDAPPHPRPRGAITSQMVFTDAKKLGIEITTIILPD
jgi:hypothetical protein